MLKPLLLMEIIVVLTIGIVICLSLYFRQRSLIKKMRDKIVELHIANNKQAQSADSLDVYFAKSIENTLAQYEKLTNSNTIIFDISSAYSEKVAALRYLYLNVEKEAEEKKKIGKISWSFYAEKLELLMGLLNKPILDNETEHLRKELDEYKIESKAIILKLKEMIASLQQAIQGSHSRIDKEIKAIESIISNDNLSKIRSIFDEMKSYSDKLEPQTNNRIETSINTLEYEMESSDRYITNIKDNSNPNAPVNFDEINKLKESNKTQKSIISNLEDEIFLLKESVDTNISQDMQDLKAAEISRLERAVKEYEGCVVVLEGQIDDLYNRLEDQAKQPKAVDSDQDLQSLNQELTGMSNRMNALANDYQQAVALNRSIYSFGQCNSVKDIANNMIKLLKEFNVPVGFSIHTAVGNADYFPAQLFNDELKKQVKNQAQHEHMGYLNGNYFFTSHGIKMIVFPAENQADSINSTISGLVCVASEIIQRLENIYLNKKNNANIEGWSTMAKNKIAHIDIQFSYQADENKKVYSQFLADLQKSYALLELHGEGAVLLDNAINEYGIRMSLLSHGTDVMKKELEKLVTHFSTLRMQNLPQSETPTKV